MARLHIALEEGFVDEPVTVRVNGAEVFTSPRVKTRFQIGLAQSFATDVAAAEAEIEIVLPANGSSRTVRIPLAGDTFVGVSLDGSKNITHRVSSEPFGYV